MYLDKMNIEDRTVFPGCHVSRVFDVLLAQKIVCNLLFEKCSKFQISYILGCHSTPSHIYTKSSPLVISFTFLVDLFVNLELSILLISEV